MTSMIMDLKTYPPTVKNAVIFLMTGWLWHLFSLYHYFLKGDLPGNQVVICVLVWFFVLKLKNWARILCMLCNALIILMYLFVGATFFLAGNVHYGMVALFNIVLFSFSTYYLAVKPTADFFKAHSKKPEESEAGPEDRG